MLIQFEIEEKLITLKELNDFEETLSSTLPDDYRQHMLKYNGGLVSQSNIQHKNYPDSIDTGLSYFFSVKYGSDTIEEVIQDLSEFVPSGFIPIGKNKGGGYIIMSLNKDNTYGEIKEVYADAELNYMSPTFTQYLEDMVESGH